ncbi:MAG: putative monovalent cation/H+ antiporter subunit A [Chlorobi bacterium]|nr:putative monovalent cation/H+ antiporter subunit A [Chlorobiota bacterium]
MPLFYLLLTGFIVSAVLPFLSRRVKGYSGWVAVLLPLALLFRFLAFYPRIAAGEIIRESVLWVPSLGINLTFVLDGLSLAFALIITLVGAAVFLYAGAYMRHDKEMPRFFFSISLFMNSMLGLVLSDNMAAMFVFWELTGISSFLLIGFSHHDLQSRKSALQALLVTGGGGLALLAGLILLSGLSGTMELSELYPQHDRVVSSPLYPAIALLVMIGAFTKSAQFPFHFWLPNAMAAPTPVSAYLHSATMVKAGIYLLSRMNHVLGGTALWQDSLLVVGALTMVGTAILAFSQTDLKKLLAYSTLSVLGTLCMMIGIGSELAIKAFFVYLVAHSLYKGTLFLVAGTIDHAAGTREVGMLGGLGRMMPFTMATALLASLSMMGVIPLVGFIGKETLYASILELEDWGRYLVVAAVAANGLLVMITLLAGIRPFIGKLPQFPSTPHEAPIAMLAGPACLAVFGLLAGLFPDYFLGSLLDRFASVVLADTLTFRIKLWHGFNEVLLLSFVTFFCGMLFSVLRRKMLPHLKERHIMPFLKPSAWYDAALEALMRLARIQTRILQNGSLRNYVTVIVTTAVALGAAALAGTVSALPAFPAGDVTFYEVAIVSIILFSILLLITSSSRLKAVIALGVMGFSIGIIFILYGAPDLALTSFAIETLSVILFVLVLYRLPRFSTYSTTASRFRDVLIAGSVGVFMSVMVLLTASGELDSGLKRYFAEASLPEGKGRNIVNVILVDFRAIDTLGEITVLAVAAIGVFSMLKLVIKGYPKEERS